MIENCYEIVFHVDVIRCECVNWNRAIGVVNREHKMTLNLKIAYVFFSSFRRIVVITFFLRLFLSLSLSHSLSPSPNQINRGTYKTNKYFFF